MRNGGTSGSYASSTVFVVDDDSGARESLQTLVESVHLQTETYSDAHAFLKAYDFSRPGCLVLDVRMPGMSGIDLQEHLIENQIGVPSIFVTGFGDVPMALRAIKMGAVDFLEKPFRVQVLLDRIQEALELDIQRRRVLAERNEITKRFEQLTLRERQVIDLTIAGKSAKGIASLLQISPKTARIHRARGMDKMQGISILRLARLASTDSKT